MAWTSFNCLRPDFLVRSISDGTTFPVQRGALNNSEVFRDMFTVCETGPPAPRKVDDQVLELHEPGNILAALIRILHDPPIPPIPIPTDDIQDDRFRVKVPKVQYIPETVIPLPLLVSLFFNLVDKYELPDSVSDILCVHLTAHAHVHPLRVYSFACMHALDKVAASASQYLDPIASYSLQDVRTLPNIDSYHRVVQLQDLRVKKLRELVLAEGIFPRGYGECPAHKEQTMDLWDRQRKALAPKIQTNTDVAGEMDRLTETLQHCKACYKACIAAVDLLAYKGFRLPKRIDQLPDNY
ncbi:hypothetical protein BDQ17DRAFT_1340266 [Cyathus striatus]|nr:hypothetical protein BDQ17DRAFT_1340266 [Cyathus striatus]